MSDKMDHQNGKPAWISFFDGDVYHQYQSFVRTRDFNKILQTQRAEDSSKLQDLKPWPQQEVASHPADDPITNPDAEYSEIPADRTLPPDVIFPSAEEAKARRKRTRTYVLLGILVMSLVAMLVALLLHFHLQKSLFGSASLTGGGTTPLPPGFGRTSSLQATDRSGANTKNAFFHHPDPNFLKTISRDANKVIGDLPPFEPAKFPNDVTMIPTSGIEASVFGKRPAPITMATPNVVSTLLERELQLKCLIRGEGDWQSLAIVRLADTGTGDTLEVAKFSTTPDAASGARTDRRVKYDVRKSGNDVTFIVTISHPVCSDDGFYQCVVTLTPGVVMTSRFRVTLSSPSQGPVLHVPDEIVEDKPTRLKTTWDAGNPEFNGILEWDILDNNTWSELSYTEYQQTQTRTNCSTIIESQFLVTPKLAWNATRIRASVIPTPSFMDTADTAAGVSLESQHEEILVVPADVCNGSSNGTFISHPYTCHKFIRCIDNDILVFVCPSNLCFDLDPETCVKASDHVV
ncbi:uncharacterized protein LOC124269134 isoform X1 [Haliotis rubra]|uniref:uncharacterized protein LOC124269134 isoform X1 n=1 Tax=Haliotis rubra TaxID=36100 RepID=UPI001EE5A970|nr:uncharacterized protein LOC124269134 isoform X1 [Haliotis rubra]